MRGGLAQIDIPCPCPPPGMRSQTRQKVRMSSGGPRTRECSVRSRQTAGAVRRCAFGSARRRARRSAAVHHHEIRLGIDHSQHPRVRFVEELLPVVLIASQAGSDVLVVVERNQGCHRRHHVHTVLELVESKQTGRFGHRDRVPDPQARQPVNLEKLRVTMTCGSASQRSSHDT